MMKIFLYGNTLRYMKPVQIFGRVLQKVASPYESRHLIFEGESKRMPISFDELDCEDNYLSRLKPEIMLKGQVSLLHHERRLNFDPDALSVEAPLWKYNLLYFEFAVALAARCKQTKNNEYLLALDNALLDFKRANPSPKPYPASLRIVNLLIAADIAWDEMSSNLRDEIYRVAYCDYIYLKGHMETYLLGNHYFENLVALIIAASVFGQDRECEKYIEMLRKQSNEQFLEDGLHYELSPMYHNVVLEGLLRVARCLRVSCEVPAWLLQTIQKSLSAAAYLEKDLTRIPLFNDSGDNVAKPFNSLLAAVETEFGLRPSCVKELTMSGYYRIDDDDLTLIVDSGKIGPDYIPGHGHCDCLSFELSVDGKPIFVNSGTYQYQGELRKYFRSTRAHNTLTIGGREQSECWGEHRVARRISNVRANMNGSTISGTYKSYSGEHHSREFTLNGRRLTVLDTIKARTTEEVHSYLHLAPAYTFESHENCISVMDGKKRICEIHAIDCETSIFVDGELTYYSEEFGKLEKGSTIVFSWTSDSARHGYSIQFV